MPATLSMIEIIGGERDFVEQLTDSLNTSGAKVVSGSENASTLNILRLDYDSQVSKTDASGHATGYNYTYILDYSVTNAAGDTLQQPTSLNQTRSQEYDPSQELQAEEEREFLKEEMEKELIVQVLRRLSRL